MVRVKAFLSQLVPGSQLYSWSFSLDTRTLIYLSQLMLLLFTFLSFLGDRVEYKVFIVVLCADFFHVQREDILNDY